MNEIGVGAVLDPFEDGMRLAELQLIPAHMRDFERRIARRERPDLALDPAQSVDGLEFAAAFGQELHADANAEERSPIAQHDLAQRLLHPRHGSKAAAAIGESADTG